MKQNLARDFLLLAAVAFRKQKFGEAGALFATAMASDDANELLKHLDPDGDIDVDGASVDSGMTAQAGDAPRVGLFAIAKSIGESMSSISLSASDEEADDDEEEDEGPEIEDNIEEDMDDEDDGTTDDFSDEIPGQKVIQSSLSSSNQGGGAAKKIKLVPVTNTPIRVK